MYGKLIDGRFVKAKHFIVTDKTTIINPTDEMYEQNGYKKLITDEIPTLTDEQMLEPYYEETEKAIYKHWRVV